MIKISSQIDMRLLCWKAKPLRPLDPSSEIRETPQLFNAVPAVRLLNLRERPAPWAIERGNLVIAEMAAREAGNLTLAVALSLLCLYAATDWPRPRNRQGDHISTQRGGAVQRAAMPVMGACLSLLRRETAPIAVSTSVDAGTEGNLRSATCRDQ
jgi:hypothetical protein